MNISRYNLLLLRTFTNAKTNAKDLKTMKKKKKS